MRDAYVADVGDYGKYGLLRSIVNGNQLWKLGVIWYLTDTHEQNNDGKHAGYLSGSTNNKIFRSCDPELYDALKSIRQCLCPSLVSIEKSSVLPAKTKYYRVPVPTRQPTRTRNEEQSLTARRSNWYSRAVAAMGESNIVFLDPDNGLILPDIQATSALEQYGKAPSHKHAYWHEVRKLLDRGISVVAYHHLGRQLGGHVRQIQNTSVTILSFGYDADAVHYRRGSARVFFVIPATNSHRSILAESVGRFVSKWSEHCQLVRQFGDK